MAAAVAVPAAWQPAAAALHLLVGGAFCARVCSPFAVCVFVLGAADFSITWSSAFLRRAAAASQKGQTLVNFFSVIDARLDYVVGPISLFADARGRLKVTYMAC
jgi:hypothetical protein